MKYRLAILFVFLTAAGLYWLSRPTALPAAPQMPAAKVEPTPSPTIERVSIEAPKLPPSSPTGVMPGPIIQLREIPSAPKDQAEEIAAAIKDIVTRLNAGDTAGVIQKYDAFRSKPPPPGGEFSPSPDEFQRLLGEYSGEMTTLLQSLAAVTPEHNNVDNTDVYSYVIVDPVTGEKTSYTIYQTPTGWNFDFNMIVTWDWEVKHPSQR